MNPQSVATRRIVIGADDCGLDRSIDAAVLALADAGRLSATSALVDGASWSAAAAALRERPRESFEVGLHLNLTESLTPGRWRLPLPLLVAAAYGGVLGLHGLRGEWRRQLDAFEHALGRPPDFIDGHQHVHQLPRVRDALFDVLAERTPQPTPWLRSCAAPRWQPGVDPGAAARAKAGLIAGLGARAFARLARRGGYRTNRTLLGVRVLNADAAGLELAMQAWLAVAGEGDLLLCHPGLDASGARTAEYRLLSGAPFGRWLAEQRIAVATMGAIVGR